MQASHTADETAAGELDRLKKVATSRSGLWIAAGMALLGLLAFVAVFNWLLPNAGAGLDGASLIVLGLLFSLVPAILWLFLFYVMDRLEPEPKRMVFNVFLLGVLVAAALLNPILNGIFVVDKWLYANWWSQLLGSILVVGFVEQAMVWAIVRYAVFPHPEFDERVDGVIYAIAAGLGLATVLNFHYVLASGGVDLSIGSMRMVVTAMAQASFAGILGYFIGQARFERTPFYYMPLGITLAATVSGLFAFLLDRTVRGTFSSYPWTDLVFAAVVAVVSLAAVLWLITRANEETLRLAHAPSAAPLFPVADRSVETSAVPSIESRVDASAGEPSAMPAAPSPEEGNA